MITGELLFRWILQTIVALVSTVAFAIIFHTPKKEYLYAGITGGAGWLVYLICVDFGLDTVISSFFAAVTLCWLSRIFSFSRKEPASIFLFPGIFPIVPGAGIYYTGYHIFMTDNTLAMSKGLETIKIAIAIALGLGIVLSLPSFFFTLKRKPSKNKGGCRQ